MSQMFDTMQKMMQMSMGGPGGMPMRGRGQHRGRGGFPRGRGGAPQRGRGGYRGAPRGGYQGPPQAYPPHQMPPTMAPPTAAPADGLIGLTAEQIKGLGATPDEVKQNFGEKVYLRVQKRGLEDELAGKVTGILIDQDVENLAAMVATEASLSEKIEEAKALVQSAQ